MLTPASVAALSVDTALFWATWSFLNTLINILSEVNLDTLENVDLFIINIRIIIHARFITAAFITFTLIILFILNESWGTWSETAAAE